MFLFLLNLILTGTPQVKEISNTPVTSATSIRAAIHRRYFAKQKLQHALSRNVSYLPSSVDSTRIWLTSDNHEVTTK